MDANGMTGAAPSRFQGDRDYRTASAAEALEGSAEGAPADLRYFLRRPKFVGEGKEYTTKLFRLVDEGGQKRRKKFLETLHNAIPSEDYIGRKYGPDPYMWIAEWAKANGETGACSEEIDIDESWRARHESQSQKGAAGLPVVGMPSYSPAGGLDQDLDRLQKLTAIVQSMSQGSDPVKIAEKMIDGFSRVMDKVMEGQVRTLGRVQELIRDKEDQVLRGNEADQVDDAGGDDEDDSLPVVIPSAVPAEGEWPKWVKDLIPTVLEFVPALLGDGVAARLLSGVLAKNKTFQAVASDPEKFPIAVAALVSELGEDKTRKVLGILEHNGVLNIGSPVPAAGAPGDPAAPSGSLASGGMPAATVEVARGVKASGAVQGKAGKTKGKK